MPLSIHPTNNISIYLTPRFIYTSDVIYASPNSEKHGIRNQYHIFGSSYGLLLGNKHKLILEVSNFDKELYKPSLFTIGYSFTFKQ